MNYNNPQTKGTARFISVVCGSLFCLFSFLYLWQVQGVVLGMAQHVLSQGLTVYSPLVGAAIITFLLLLLQVILNRILRVSGEWYCFSFFPSFFTLAMITSVDQSAYEGFSFGHWIFTYPIGLILYVVLAIVVKQLPSSYDSRSGSLMIRLMIPNLLIFLFFSVLSLSLSKNSETLYNQLEIEYNLSRGNIDKALEIGAKSPATNAQITALRAYALSKSGLLAERLFCYPQEYGADGLLLQRADTVRMIFSPQTLYRELGAYPRYHKEPAVEFLELLDKSDKAKQPMAQDYLLCAYLLEGSLDKFVDKLATIYALNDSVVELPRYYEEALVLYQRRNPGRFTYRNAIQETNLADYLKMVRSASSSVMGGNRTRRDFGTTYWWYYDSLKKK